ncbi:MAG: hypothetical protein ABIF82_07010 [Planctomycetota bacterium]
MASVQYELVSVDGPVTVGYYRSGGRWWAVARQFSIMGSGKTKDDAFQQLRELVNEYVEECITEGTTAFFFPCEDEDWRRTRDQQNFHVVLVFQRTTPYQKPMCERVEPDELDTLSRFGSRFVSGGLAEVAYERVN